LVRRLLRRGHSKAAAESALAELEAGGLLDDAEFARHYARTRARRRRLGAARLVADLRRLGVEERVAAGAVAEALAADGVDTASLAREAAQRKLRSLTGLAPRERARRLRAYLLRRGFAASEVSAVVKEAVKS
jgi:regulatory protein